MSNKQYNILKWLVTTAIPAVIVLITALWEIWGLPYLAPIVGTVSAVNAFMGALLGISSATYAAANTPEPSLERPIEDTTAEDFEIEG